MSSPHSERASSPLPLSGSGRLRRARILELATRAQRRRVVRRRTGRSVLGIAVVLALAVGLRAALPPAVVSQQPAPPIAATSPHAGEQTPKHSPTPDAIPPTPPPALANQDAADAPRGTPAIRIVRTEPGSIPFVRTSSSPPVERLTDEELGSVMAAAGKPTGLVRVADRVLLAEELAAEIDQDSQPHNEEESLPFRF